MKRIVGMSREVWAAKSLRPLKSLLLGGSRRATEEKPASTCVASCGCIAEGVRRKACVHMRRFSWVGRGGRTASRLGPPSTLPVAVSPTAKSH